MSLPPVTSRLADYRLWLPVIRPSSEFNDTIIPRAQKVAKLKSDWREASFQLDVNRAEPFGKALLDDGDYPPEWCYLCLRLASAIVRLQSPIGTQAVIHMRSRKLTVPLTVTDLCSEIGGDIWRSDGALFIMWGVSEGVFRKASYPITCSGVLSPYSTDSGSAGLRARMMPGRSASPSTSRRPVCAVALRKRCSFDFKANLLSSTRRLAADFTTDPKWNTAPNDLTGLTNPTAVQSAANTYLADGRHGQDDGKFGRYAGQCDDGDGLRPPELADVADAGRRAHEGARGLGRRRISRHCLDRG